MFDYGRGIVGYALTLISLIHCSFASVISLIVIAILIYHKYNNRLKREEKITLILFVNIYLLIFIYIITLISSNIPTLLGDVDGNNFDSSWCIFRGYFICVMCCALYHAFIIQAFFRFCRIVYSKFRWLQSYCFFVISVPILIIGASILLCPLLIWNAVIYLPNEHYCFVLLTNIRGFLWVVVICYGMPVFYLSLIYNRIISFIHQQPHNLALAIKRRQQRDLLAIQRIFINVSLLIVIGLPCVIVMVMAFINGVEHPLAYRILFMGVEVSLTVLSIEMIFMTPQLKKIVIRRRQHNQAAPIEGSIEMRAMTTVQ